MDDEVRNAYEVIDRHQGMLIDVMQQTEAEYEKEQSEARERWEKKEREHTEAQKERAKKVRFLGSNPQMSENIRRYFKGLL